MKRILSFILVIGILLSNLWVSSAIAIEETLLNEEISQNKDIIQEDIKTNTEQDLSKDEVIEIIEDSNKTENVEELPLQEGQIYEDSLDGIINSEPSGVIDYNVSPETSLFKFDDYLIPSPRVSSDPIIGVNHPVNPGDVMLFKEAKAVQGKVNTWEITVRIEGRNKPITSDIVLVVDRSGSMNTTPVSRMVEAKKAAKKFAEQILSCEQCRMGLVSFASDVKVDQNLNNSYTALNTAIDKLSANGGTFTQAGIREARGMLSKSDAVNKHIVLISDGEPTYSYALKNPDTYATNPVENVEASYGKQGFIITTKGKETVSAINAVDFNYPTVVGEGTAMRHIYNYKAPSSGYKMYNHGNSAISEANFAGIDGYNLFTIGIKTNPDGDKVLDSMKQGIGSFTKVDDPSQLTPILKQIAGEIGSAVKDAKIVDPMGPGFEISEENISKIITSQGKAVYENNRISWNPGTLTKPIKEDSDINYAELKYIVEINDDIINADNTDNLYPTNGETTVEYTNVYNEKKNENFPIPTVKPLLYNLTKEVQDKDGKIIQKDRNFEISVIGPSDYNKTVKLNANKNNSSGKITELRTPGKYKIVETTDINDYEVSYFVNGIETSEFNIINNDDEDLDIKVINKEKDGKITISKEIEENELLDTSEFQFKITGPDNFERIIKLPENGLWEKEINDLKQGKYTITELTENYKTSVKVNEEDFKDKKFAEIYLQDGEIEQNILFKNEYNRADLQIQKRNSKDESKLENVEFTLYQSDNSWKLGKKLVEKITENNGIINFESLLPGKYILKETKVPDGFTSEASYWKVEVNMSGEVNITTNKDKLVKSETINGKPTFIIYNIPGFNLPITGARGTQVFKFAGLSISLLAILGLTYKKKYEKN